MGPETATLYYCEWVYIMILCLSYYDFIVVNYICVVHNSGLKNRFANGSEIPPPPVSASEVVSSFSMVIH